VTAVRLAGTAAARLAARGRTGQGFSAKDRDGRARATPAQLCPQPRAGLHGVFWPPRRASAYPDVRTGYLL